MVKTEMGTNLTILKIKSPRRTNEKNYMDTKKR